MSNTAYADDSAPLAESGGVNGPAGVNGPGAAGPDDFDWRAAMAGGDAERRAALERYADLPAYDKAFRDTQTALRGRNEGMIRLPDEYATHEDLAAFNTALGVPETHADYELPAAPEGLALSEADEAFLTRAVADIHEKGGLMASPEVVSGMAALYHQAVEEREAQAVALAEQAQLETEQNLREEFGAQYQLNMQYAENAVANFFPDASADMDDPNNPLSWQLMDGSRLGDNETFIRAMIAAGRMTMDDPHFLSTLTRQNAMSADRLQDEISRIQGWRTSTDAAERQKYQEASQPGGRLHDLLERRNRVRKGG